MFPMPMPFLRMVNDEGTSFKADFPLPRKLEGYLFPDTYQIPVGEDGRKIVQRMVDTFARRVADGKEEDVAASRRPP